MQVSVTQFGSPQVVSENIELVYYCDGGVTICRHVSSFASILLCFFYLRLLESSRAYKTGRIEET